MTTGKRVLLAKGKGYLNATGPQARFIIFLVLVLLFYTIIVRIFQKLAEILQFPLFLPIALVTLFIFLGIVGTLYSHKFLGPLYRIRRAIDQMMAGDLAINLKLRESDEPLLKDLAGSIDLLCEQGRKAHTVIQDAAATLFNELQTLSEKIERGAGSSELKGQAENVRKKQELLDRAIRSYRKA
jgi:hypothetical protein